MLCNTCEKEIPDCEWKKQCIDCYKLKYKRCLLCDKKKKNTYLFCYLCNSTKKDQCIFKLRENAQNDLHETYINRFNELNSQKQCKECYNQIPTRLKWKDYCSTCWFCHKM